MNPFTRKPVFGVCDQVRLKLCCSATATYVLFLKVFYKGFFKSFIVLYADRICPEHHFVENRIENFQSV